MSYIKVKNISIKKNDKITITGASNNCRPISYSTFAFNGRKEDLLLSLLDGSLQLNNGCYNFKYALNKVYLNKDLIKDIDNWRWDWNDIKQYYYIGKKSWRKNEIELPCLSDDYIVTFDYTYEDTGERYQQCLKKEQYNELKGKHDNAVNILTSIFYKALDNYKKEV